MTRTRHTYRAVLLYLLTSAGATEGWAQKVAADVSPQVQQLYAEAHAAQQQGDTDRAIADYRQILKLSPRLGPAYNNLGLLLYKRAEFTDAAEVLRKGLAVDPRMKTAQALLGLSEFRLGRYAAAVTELRKALEADPANAEVEIALARSEIAGTDPAAGTDRLRSYLKRNPQDQQAWYLLGKTYLQLSEQALGEVSRIDPDSVTAHLIAGEVDESMRNFDGALGEYNKAVEKGPNQPGTHYHLGNAFWLEENWGSAEGEFRAELKNDPHNCVTEWKLGDSLLAQNKSAEEALPVLDGAIADCPKLMQARVDRANALLKLNEPQKALEDLLPAQAAAPTEPSIFFSLSKAYAALGNHQEAHTALETYGRLKREQSQKTAQQAKDVLDVKDQAH